ncbi:MAG: helix-turn-helix domain-containing protein [Chloroflexi bacterium]|nr:helix-turn-helix domain-containing protein [Chloroflexota bacterium]
MPVSKFRFIDLPTSAERLGVSRNRLLQWVDEGRIKPFSGKGQQSVFRTSDVERFVEELRAETSAGERHRQEVGESSSPQQSAAPGQQEATRTRRRDAIKLMGTRLSMDSRWAEMSDKDIATWLDALEPVQYERVQKVAKIAIERLERVLEMMLTFEERSKSEENK